MKYTITAFLFLISMKAFSASFAFNPAACGDTPVSKCQTEATICNIKADSPLNVREMASANAEPVAQLELMTTVRVDMFKKQKKDGADPTKTWVHIDGASQIYDKKGKALAEAPQFTVHGWVRTDFLCQ